LVYDEYPSNYDEWNLEDFPSDLMPEICIVDGHVFNLINLRIMENLIKILVFVFFATGLFANTDKPTEGSTLQVIAPSGLNLRAQPAMSASTLITMPHGAEVTLLAFEESGEIQWCSRMGIRWVSNHFECAFA